MSAYQYYEFAALDRALDTRQQAELRAISTRATITAAGFVNTYQWGDLKADPRKLIERYFDAFLYLANWGTHRLMFRVPARLLDQQTAAMYCVGDSANASTGRGYTVIDLVAEDDEGMSDEDWTEGGGEGRLASIVPGRFDLACGDRRLLYLAWLLCVQAGQVADDALEPPVPPHLDRLTASLHSVVAFLRVDDRLIAAAASASPDSHVETDRSRLLRGRLAAISEPDKDELLLRVALGDLHLARADLLTACGPEVPPGSDGSVRRTAGELSALAQTR